MRNISARNIKRPWQTIVALTVVRKLIRWKVMRGAKSAGQKSEKGRMRRGIRRLRQISKKAVSVTGKTVKDMPNGDSVRGAEGRGQKVTHVVRDALKKEPREHVEDGLRIERDTIKNNLSTGGSGANSESQSISARGAAKILTSVKGRCVPNASSSQEESVKG